MLTHESFEVAYKSYIAGQEFLRAGGLDVKILSRAFAKLNSLECLNLNPMSQIAAHRLYDVFGPVKGLELLARDGKYTFPVLVRALAISKRKIRTFSIGSSNEFDNADPDIYKAGPVSVARHLSPHAFAQAFNDPDIHGYREAFGHLSKLATCKFVSDSTDPVKIAQIAHGVHTLISAASQNIESITIGEIFPSILPRPSLESIVRPGSTKCLRELFMGNCNTTLIAANRIFRGVRNTLVKLRFSDITITDGEWSAVLLRMREVEFPALKLFMLQKCAGIEGKVECQEYISHGTDDDPIVKKRGVPVG